MLHLLTLAKQTGIAATAKQWCELIGLKEQNLSAYS